MQKLKKYLESKGIKYTATTYGANYFYDHSLDLHFDGVCIGFTFKTAEEAKQSMKDRRTIEKYIDRYGYSVIMRGGYPGYNYISIVKATDLDALKTYDLFADKAREECEKHMHFAHEYYGEAGYKSRAAIIDQELKGIMEFYEDEYKEFLRAEQKAAA